MKVSVIIPAYNAASFISKAIESVLLQPEVEACLVIDDGSTDETVQEVLKYQERDDRVQLFSHPERTNLGPGASRNLGLRNAKSEFIAFLDADDYWVENRFTETKKIFSSHEDAGAVYEAIADESWAAESKNGNVTMMQPSHGPREAFLDMAPFGKNGNFSLIGLTVKRAAAERAGFFSEDLRLTQDTEWMARLALTANLYPGSPRHIVARRRLHTHNSSKNTDLLHQSRVEMCFTLLNWMVEENLAFEYKESVVNVLLKYHYELNCLGSEKWVTRKRNDLKFLKRLKRLEPQAMQLPRVKYFRRLVLLLPNRVHFNFYK